MNLTRIDIKLSSLSHHVFSSNSIVDSAPGQKLMDIIDKRSIFIEALYSVQTESLRVIDCFYRSMVSERRLEHRVHLSDQYVDAIMIDEE